MRWYLEKFFKDTLWRPPLLFGRGGVLARFFFFC